ncbi:hypothetical protein CAPTEDRAFT_191834 [Capitella teleta]|uniref:Uncharacterized protein n=1 Tax=Capitella teleta TaxID=283909 RepID=R7U521_CAPTE|nr:hypothetical protein CAPTEDRAFT_191834 [Capitella teleta]|eukprot:ELT98786.1 hypothetical protein CAPTEDRAFT_191834 [Capitella teleta]
MLCEFDRAKAVLSKAQKYHPNNRTVAQMLSQVNESMKRFQQVDRQFWKRAFGNKSTEDVNTEKKIPRAIIEDCSPQFKEAVKSCLDEFISNEELAEMPFPQQNFCEAEIAAIQTFAEDLNLGVEVRSKECVRIVKNKSPNDVNISTEDAVE